MEPTIHLRAEFMKSSTRMSECPAPALPEYAFVGRSNVGKSSLINMLVGRKDLAKTSGRPGKTQLINHFSIERPPAKGPQWYLVDLPGFGYARVSKTLKASFQKLMYPYLEKRENLMCVFMLIDSRHEAQAIDLDLMEWMAKRSIPFCIVFTKIDKLKPMALQRNIDAYNEKMLESWEETPMQFLTSASLSEGRDDLAAFIEQTNKAFRMEN